MAEEKVARLVEDIRFPHGANQQKANVRVIIREPAGLFFGAENHKVTGGTNGTFDMEGTVC